jgi:hypothetical protein
MSVAKSVRGLSVALLWALGIVIAGAVISFLGVRFMGGISGFESWLSNHRFHLLAWRLVVYGATFIGWRSMRTRLLLREPDAATRLGRCEISALAAILALESALWIRSW